MVRKDTDLGRAGLSSETFSILKHWNRSSLPGEGQQEKAERKAGLTGRKTTSFSGGDARDWGELSPPHPV